ncbi:helix-turn-helix transcriptional regulator [Streptomyces sp. NPDC003077]|uniref:helix-turn-helix domain-containing protein n=1 Tax=Streptomyces sp. NPDC003077 TaxID=3154443 RepID=UPI0033A5C3C3
MGLRANPTGRQRRFGAEVRKLRESAGLSVAEAASLLGMKPPHLSNIEAGRTSLSEERLRSLASASGLIDGTYIDALIELGQASGKGWWSEYRERLPASFLDYAELEASARKLSGYEPLFVPGLLQTREYATAIHHHGYSRNTYEWHETAIEFRMRRQEALTKNQALQFRAIMHEAALRPTLGDGEVMRDQLLKLIEMARLPNVTVQVLPFDGPVPYGTPFILFEPGISRLGTVAVPQVHGTVYLGDEVSLTRYNEDFETLSRLALPAVGEETMGKKRLRKDSLGLMQQLLYPML